MQYIKGSWCNNAVLIHAKKWDRREETPMGEREYRRLWERMDKMRERRSRALAERKKVKETAYILMEV